MICGHRQWSLSCAMPVSLAVGAWAQKVIHPSAGLTKEYIVALEKAPKSAQMATLAKGAEVEGSWVTPIEVRRCFGDSYTCV